MTSPYKNKFETFFGCLFHSWGGDTPKEAIWAANDFIDALNELFDFGITDRFDLEYVTEQGREWSALSDEIYQKLLTKK